MNCDGAIDIHMWDTSNVTDMYRMFGNPTPVGHYITSVNLVGLNTSKVKNMGEMFIQQARLETIDLRSFEYDSMSNSGFDKMFNGCSQLRTIYTQQDTD